MIDFSKAYNRADFVNYLRRDFLPDDFEQEEKDVPFWSQMNYASVATCLGKSKTLNLVVYEIKHHSPHDARVGLSKDAFRMLAGEKQNRALVIFVPEDNSDNYRFSLIEIQLSIGENDSNVTRTYSNPRRYSYYLGKGIACYTPNKYLNELGRVKDVKDLFERFSVEVLTKAFYQELSDWYAWAIKEISFPNDITITDDDAKYNHEGAIRLITRLIFVWFLKQRGLIPWQFFDEDYIRENLLDNFNPNAKVDLFYKAVDSKYYKAILQNLFFAMLNCPICKEGSKEIDQRRFSKADPSDRDNNKLMRYKSLFKNPDLFLQLANQRVPFLNGGLFDCLDDKKHKLYYDGFSDSNESQKQLRVPDYLFFGENVGKNIDLSEFYGDTNKKKVSARGIIDILKRYNFTVEENMPFDKDVSLDPELLGKVFENLLASYNPETQQTARKQTGSFYTPREIVQYMVDESLVAHLKRTVSPDLEAEYRKLLAYNDDPVELSEEQKTKIMQSLYNCKILDPACGSGAFPVGILQQMVHILTQIDPDNTRWKDMLFKIVNDESSETFKNSTPEERKDQQDDLYRSFNDSYNRPDYSRKLYLIENCIYGVDIQPIAIQISKLRFFISLVVDQNINDDPTDNFGIRPLPNLEAKFVAANSLVRLNRGEANLFDTDAIKEKEALLKIAKHKIFGAKTSRTKEKYREQVRTLRSEIADMLIEQRLVGNEQARQLNNWDMFDQNTYAPFFDPEWMFGIKDGFDIVIANPPYVLLQNTDIPLNQQEYLKRTYNVAQYKVDLYHLFIERGITLLGQGGNLCYITPSNFLTNNYTDKLRHYLLFENSLISIINIEDLVFTANVHTCILNVIHEIPSDNVPIYYHKANIIDNCLTMGMSRETNRTAYRNVHGYIIQPNDSEVVEKIISKMNLVSKPLNSYATVKFGMQLRNRKIYPFDVTEDRSQITSYHRKCLTGKNIVPYSSNYSGLYCYFNREAKCGGCWDKEIHDTKIKVLVRQVGETPVCGIDVNSYAILNSAFMIVPFSINPFFVMALINSKLLKFYWRQKFEDKRKTFPKIKGTYLELLPIVIQCVDKISNIAETIYKELNCNPLYDYNKDVIKIDEFVYHIYNITYDEVLIVDPNTPITREEYDNFKI